MQTLQDLVASLEGRGCATAISWKEDSKLHKLSFKELYHQIIHYSKGFLQLGLGPGDRIAIFSRNIPEWIGITLGIDNAGLIDVPRGETSTLEEINYIIEHSQAKVAIVEDDTLLDRVKERKHPNLEGILSIREINGVTNILKIEEKGKNSKKSLPDLTKNDTASIIYTSGTTGTPKGVELTHGNFVSNINAVLKRVPIFDNDKLISILPAWHAFERMAKYVALAAGAETFYTTSQSILQDLAEQKPTFMASVPRIWELIYNKIMEKVKEESAPKRRLFHIALKASIDYKKKEGFNLLRLIEALSYNYLDKKVFSELRAKLGGRFKYAVSGGSALPRRIDDFFNAAGIEVLEGYGLTETAPVLSVRIPGKKSLGSVGPLLEGVKAKIIDPETGNKLPIGKEGVIYVNGPNVMKGYYKNFEETRKVLKDGWLDTGDLGHFDKKGNLAISGRIKDIIVLLNGENVNPIPIEEELIQSDFIAAAVVTGQNWKNLGALIVPNFEHLKQYYKEKGIPVSEDNSEPFDFNHPRIKDIYKSEINRLVNKSARFKHYERIQEFRLVSEPFSIGKELTPTLKPIRKKIEELYESKISNMKETMHKK